MKWIRDIGYALLWTALVKTTCSQLNKHMYNQPTTNIS
jgi:hypothetical protein